MLDNVERAFLAAVDRLTREKYNDTDGAAVADELAIAGHKPDDIVLYNLMQRLREEGYLEASPAGGMDFRGAALMRLTEFGRDEAREVDPFERVRDEARHALASKAFAEQYPGAFDAWAAAERLLWEDATDTNRTTIGHNVRDAAQRFATALVEQHGPPKVDPDQTKVELRLGAVIAMHRERLGDARRRALDALGDLWEANNRLIQRQEHGASKEGAKVTWDDARRIVYLTMFLMVEFVATFEDLPPEPPAHLERG